MFIEQLFILFSMYCVEFRKYQYNWDTVPFLQSNNLTGVLEQKRHYKNKIIL